MLQFVRRLIATAAIVESIRAESLAFISHGSHPVSPSSINDATRERDVQRTQLSIRCDKSSRRGVCLFSTSPATSSSPSKQPKQKSTKKKNVQPTARSIAINALATSAASNSGAHVNAAAFATQQLEQDEHYNEMEARDRAFARLLVATVERRLGQIDGVLGSCIEKYPPKKVS